MALKVGELFASLSIDDKDATSALGRLKDGFDAIVKVISDMGIDTDFSFGNIVDTGKDFYAQMSKVAAIAKASASDREALTRAAKDAGASTVWTATEAGEALEYMAMAGWDTDEMIAGLVPIMNLATAAGEELGRTSDIVTDAMTAFGIEITTENVQHFADVLAAAATSSNTTVSMLGESFKYVAPVAGALGYTVDDIAVALGVMANNGIKAGMAGRALKNLLTNMIDPTDEQFRTMEYIGLDLKDESGNLSSFLYLLEDMRDLMSVGKSDSVFEREYKEYEALEAKLASKEITQENFNKEINLLSYKDEIEDIKRFVSERIELYDLYDSIEQEMGAVASSEEIDINYYRRLENQLEDVGVEIERLIRSQELEIETLGLNSEDMKRLQILIDASVLAGRQAFAGVAAIINASDEDFYALVDAIDMAEGSTQTMADTMANNLEGHITLLNSQIEALKITFSELLNPILEGVVSALSSLVGWMNSLSDSALSVEYVNEILSDLDLASSFNTSGLEKAQKAADDASNAVIAAQENVNRFASTIELKLGVSENEAQSFVNQVDALIKAGISSIEKNQYSIDVSLSSALGSGENYEKLQNELFGPYYEMVMNDAQSAGQEIRDTMMEAMTDGSISPEEAARIAVMTQNYTEAVNRATADLKFKAAINQGIGEGTVGGKGLQQIATSAYGQIDARLKMLDESYDEVISQAYLAGTALGYSQEQMAEYIAEVKSAFMQNKYNSLLEATNIVYRSISAAGLDFVAENEKMIDDFFSRQSKTQKDMSNYTSEFLKAVGASGQGTSLSQSTFQKYYEKISNMVLEYKKLGVEVPETLQEAQKRLDVLDQGNLYNMFDRWFTYQNGYGLNTFQADQFFQAFGSVEEQTEYMRELYEQFVAYMQGDFAEYLDYSAGESITEQYTAGLVSGIDTDICYDAGYDAGEAIKEGTKDALEVHSPSRVAEREIGAMYIAGMENGILNNLHDLTSAGAMAAQALHQSVASGTAYEVGSRQSGYAIDYDRLADAISSRPTVLNVNGRRFAEATAGDNRTAMNAYDRRVTIGYGGR